MDFFKNEKIDIFRSFRRIILKFDFDTFIKVAHQAYKELEQADIFSFDECLYVFYKYFATYEEAKGTAHPHIRKEQVKQILKAMPECEDIELGPGMYDGLIEQHFSTKYRHCDYNINHFFSGSIRRLRFYEILY